MAAIYPVKCQINGKLNIPWSATRKLKSPKLNSIEAILQESNNIKVISEEFIEKDQGTFTIATTHTQARYKLPRVVEEFVKKYPKR